MNLKEWFGTYARKGLRERTAHDTERFKFRFGRSRLAKRGIFTEQNRVDPSSNIIWYNNNTYLKTNNSGGLFGGGGGSSEMGSSLGHGHVVPAPPL